MSVTKQGNVDLTFKASGEGIGPVGVDVDHLHVVAQNSAGIDLRTVLTQSGAVSDRLAKSHVVDVPVWTSGPGRR